jgi:aryl-alcohol dehydrogenase-like predicted oxidoreductase
VDRRELGRTGLSVPPLGLGTVKIGRNRDVKYPQGFELPDDASVERLLEAALAEGVVLWDTAPAYGVAEERLGPFVARHRDRLVLCTKAGEEYGPEGSHHDFGRQALTESVHRSLRRLRTDVVDVLLLHSHGRDLEILDHSDALETIERLREAGDVRFGGISAKTAAGIERGGACLDVVMAPFGPAHRDLGEALRQVHAAGTGVLAIKVLGQGHALETDTVPAEDPIEVALRTVLGAGFVDCAVIGTRSADHLRQAAGAARRIADRPRGRAS